VIWATVLSNSRYHQINSLGLTFFVGSLISAHNAPSFTYKVALYIFAILVSIFCLALSPVPSIWKFLFRNEAVRPKYKSLEIIFPAHTEATDSNAEEQGDIVLELVLYPPLVVSSFGTLIRLHH
jgi:hypothetical protein